MQVHLVDGTYELFVGAASLQGIPGLAPVSARH
jgi:hypothetical protein